MQFCPTVFTGGQHKGCLQPIAVPPLHSEYAQGSAPSPAHQFEEGRRRAAGRVPGTRLKFLSSHMSHI